MKTSTPLLEAYFTQTRTKQNQPRMPYEILTDLIEEKILPGLQKENVNARIVNVALNIDNQLVLTQVYVERLNGFVPTGTSAQFGTTPTAYKVQVRFPFGLATQVGSKAIFFPKGTFKNLLQPYYPHGSSDLSDDLLRDFSPHDILCGPGIKKDIDITTLGIPPSDDPFKPVKEQIEAGTVSLSTDDGKESISLPYSLQEGLGYEPCARSKKYRHRQDYDIRLKMAGVYPLFYFEESKDGMMLRQHDYPGYTHLQRYKYEPDDDSENSERQSEYREFLETRNKMIEASSAGKTWMQHVEEKAAPCLFEFTILNRTMLWAESELPVIGLRRYQVELFNECLNFLAEESKKSRLATKIPKLASQARGHHSGIINMGVGSGKTYFTFTLLQHLRSSNIRRRRVEQQESKSKKTIVSFFKTAPPTMMEVIDNPPFCMAPDADVARVTQSVIDCQGLSTGTCATSIATLKQMPYEEFLTFYTTLAERAAKDSKAAVDFIERGLPRIMMKFCLDKSAHPYIVPNVFYAADWKAEWKIDWQDDYLKFKDSIDIKRLLLMVEAQKDIMQKTGMLPIDALNNLSEEFKIMEAGMRKETLFSRWLMNQVKPEIKIDYNCEIKLSDSSTINVTQDESKSAIIALLKAKYADKSQDALKDSVVLADKTKYIEYLRDKLGRLARVAALAHPKDEAGLLANLKEFRGCFLRPEIEEKIEAFFGQITEDITTLACKQNKTHADHMMLHAYFHELGVTVPPKLDFGQQIKTAISTTGPTDALNNLSEAFTAVEQSIQKDRFFTHWAVISDDKASGGAFEVELKINYAQDVKLSNGASINVSKDGDKIAERLKTKYQGNLRATRDGIVRIAALVNKDAAILMANSGGLGNKYSQEELQTQINTYLPDAVNEIMRLANKPPRTYAEHFTLYLYFNELFANIPDALHYGKCIEQSVNEEMKTDSSHLGPSKKHNKTQAMIRQFRLHAAQETLFSEVQLVQNLRARLQETLEEQATVADIKCSEGGTSVQAPDLSLYHLDEKTSAVKAAHQLAGIAALQITGSAAEENADLLWSHIPVFTPEGLAAYFEHLHSLEKKPKINFKKQFGIYTSTLSGEITADDIKQRIQQVLNSLMVADEVHKEAFKFLYDTTNSIYGRINTITQKYFKRPFIELLPCRIGMSGTINQVATQAFGQTTLYDFSIPKMIGNGIVKTIRVASYSMPVASKAMPGVELETKPPFITEAAELKSELRPERKEITQETKAELAPSSVVIDPATDQYAMDIVTDYFSQPYLNAQGDIAYAFEVSQGLLFSKVPNHQLNGKIASYFNLLVDEKLATEEEAAVQKSLFVTINQKRSARVAQLKKCQAPTESKVKEFKDGEHKEHKEREAKEPVEPELKGTETGVLSFRELTVRPQDELSVASLKQIQKQTFQNQLLARYLEYLLSISGSPKEFSQVIGLQNTLHRYGLSLADGIQAELKGDSPKIAELTEIVKLLNRVQPQQIREAELKKFIEPRIKEKKSQGLLIRMINTFKADVPGFIKALPKETESTLLSHLAATNRAELESGQSLMMLGGEAERTGYSHEPIGIIVDMPSSMEYFSQVNQYLFQLDAKEIDDSVSQIFLPLLQSLCMLTTNIFSWGEKTQAGGRALRTPEGTVQYIQYQSNINSWLEQQKLPPEHPFHVFKVEAGFQDIFTSDEKTAENEQRSVTINQIALSILLRTGPSLSYADFLTQIKAEVNKVLTQQAIEFAGYESRFQLIWAMKYAPQLALRYFKERDVQCFNGITTIKVSEIARTSTATIAMSATPSAAEVVVADSLKKEPQTQAIGPAPISFISPTLKTEPELKASDPQLTVDKEQLILQYLEEDDDPGPFGSTSRDLSTSLIESLDDSHRYKKVIHAYLRAGDISLACAINLQRLCLSDLQAIPSKIFSQKLQVYEANKGSFRKRFKTTTQTVEDLKKLQLNSESKTPQYIPKDLIELCLIARDSRSGLTRFGSFLTKNASSFFAHPQAALDPEQRKDLSATEELIVSLNEWFYRPQPLNFFLLRKS